MIYLRTMTDSEFDDFRTRSQNNYATDLANVEGIPIEEALKHAADQFNKLVPDGTRTTGQFFYQALQKESEQTVGYLWLGLQSRFGRMVISINDIAINPNYRGKGLGKLLMKLVEQESKTKSATRIRLHVFNQNETAKKLYLSMGFQPTSIDMRKEL